MVGTYHVKNEFGTDEYDIKTATKGNYEMGGGGGYWHPIQGSLARSMVSVNQHLIPWQRIGFDTA